jgi:phage portal protein BeeE
LSLLDRIKTARGSLETRMGVDGWLSNYLIPSSFQHGGVTYPMGLQGTLGGQRAMEITQTLPGHTAALKACPPAFAAQDVRAAVVSGMRFCYRYKPGAKPSNRRPNVAPRRKFFDARLALLDNPWPGGTTSDLASRMEWHAGLGGAAFVVRRQFPEPHLQVLRPDWCALLYGSQTEPDNPAHALDGEFLGTVYWNGGPNGPWGYGPEFLLPEECIHWIPKPDPLNEGMGMSWLTPAIRDIQSDVLAGQHKIKYWENGATPNLVVKGIPAVTREQFDELVEMMEERHAGAANAFKTLYLTAGADATIIGNNFQEMDFRSITAAGETRIAMLSRVPATILQISEGLQGSSLNAGNFTASRRTFADTWVYQTLADISASLAPLFKAAPDAELWFDSQDIPLLREDGKDQAEIDAVKANAIRTLVDGGFDPETAVATIAPEWLETLDHTGNVSVQLQPPGAGLQNSNEVGQILQPHND